MTFPNAKIWKCHFFVVYSDAAFVIGKLEYPEDPDRCATLEERREILSRTMDKAPCFPPQLPLRQRMNIRAVNDIDLK